MLLSRAPEFDDAGFPGPWFTHLDEVPPHMLDVVDPTRQGDDRVHKPGNPHDIAPVRAHRKLLRAKAPAPVRVVPLHRGVRRGMVGSDVVAVKRALSRAGYGRWSKTWTRLFGPFAVRNLRRFQQENGLHVDGVYGLTTHKKLVGKGAFDRWGAYLMGTAPFPATPEQRKRAKIVAAAMWGYHNRDRIHYDQWRPIDGHGHPFKLPLYTDCSGSDEDWYEWGGSPSTLHRGPAGQGYTGTHVDHGTPTSHPQPGDINFYGWDSHVHGPMHETIQVTASDKSDLCVSHGTEAGPSLVRRRYWAAYNESRSYI